MAGRIASNRGLNMTVLGAVNDLLGFFCLRTQFHGVKGDDFAAYLRTVLTEYDAKSQDNPALRGCPATVIFDNLLGLRS
eukprot:m.87661 g.87661  ORF g.87661 m.87661 type:complete len:79 (-) comp50984_c0_seq6:301-537(-)